MDEFENRGEWNVSVKRRAKKTSLLNISRSILQDYSETPQFSTLSSQIKFIPFNKERDGLNRLIKCNSQKITKPKTKCTSPSYFHKKHSSSKKALLKTPLICDTPAVGTYSFCSEWTKPTFNRKTQKKVIRSRKTLSPIEGNKSVEKIEHHKVIVKPSKKRDLFTLEGKITYLPRKKGIWEDMEIKELPKGMVFKSVEEATNIFSTYESNILNSMEKFKKQMKSIQKYL